MTILQIIGLVYLGLGLLVGFYYGEKFILYYMKKNNLPHPKVMPTLFLKVRQAFTLGFLEMLAIIMAGILWPASLYELIKNKGEFTV